MFLKSDKQLNDEDETGRRSVLPAPTPANTVDSQQPRSMSSEESNPLLHPPVDNTPIIRLSGHLSPSAFSEDGSCQFLPNGSPDCKKHFHPPPQEKTDKPKKSRSEMMRQDRRNESETQSAENLSFVPPYINHATISPHREVS